jgi:hypothetical protein
MRWNKKVERIFKLRQEQKESASNPEIREDDYYNPDEDRIVPTVGDNLEKGDLFALIVSAWIVIVPICLGVLLLIVLLAWLMLGL